VRAPLAVRERERGGELGAGGPLQAESGGGPRGRVVGWVCFFFKYISNQFQTLLNSNLLHNFSQTFSQLF
jgi:hypothetical protein